MSRPLIAPASPLSLIALGLTLSGACVSASEPVGSAAAAPDARAGATAADADAGAESQCRPGERPVVGRRVDMARACIGAAATLGCSAESRGCDDAETVVGAPDGARWWLGNLCIPDGFSALQDREEQAILSYPRCTEPEAGVAPMASECGSAGAQGCAPGECSLEGHPIDEANGCVGKKEAVGCWPAGPFCPPQALFGRDARGARWSFPSGCLPGGFALITGDEQTEVSGLSLCEQAPIPTPSCEALSVDDCSKSTRCKIARGIQYDPTRHCRWPGMVELACVDFRNGCSTVVTHASYADERTPSFQFPDGCIPLKYVSRPGGELVDAWPICPEAR